MCIRDRGVAVRILLDFDADAERIRGEVIRMLSGPSRQRPVGQTAGSRRAPNPLRPHFDWERAGVLWRPDRLVGALLHELEGVASRLLEQQFDLRVSRVRSRPAPRAIARGAASARIVPAQSAPPLPLQAPSAVRGPRWERATFLWRPEGLELRVPLNLDQGAICLLYTSRCV